MLSANFALAKLPTDPNDWECDQPRRPNYPRNFINEIYDELLQGVSFTDEENEMYLDGKAHNALDRLKLRDDFEQLWQEWLFKKRLPSHWKCGDPRNKRVSKAVSISEASDPEAAAISQFTVVQNSMAKNIPTIRRVSVWVHGEASCIFCQNKIEVLWNGRIPLGIASNPITLTPAGVVIILNLAPSDTLAAKTNQLQFTLKNGVNRPKVFVEALVPDQYFPGSEFLIPDNSYLLTFGIPKKVNVGLGLVCVNRVVIPPATKKHPESAQHVDEAQAQGYARIVTYDFGAGTDQRRKDVAKWPLMKNCRDKYKGNSLIQCDEYPQAIFKENAGAPSVKPISATDNMGSGGLIGQYLRPYKAGNQVEVVTPDSASTKLYCKPAF